jgi:hypothetical protein
VSRYGRGENLSLTGSDDAPAVVVQQPVEQQLDRQAVRAELSAARRAAHRVAARAWPTWCA